MSWQIKITEDACHSIEQSDTQLAFHEKAAAIRHVR